MDDSGDVPNEMHRDVSWLTPADVTILQFLNVSRDLNSNPSIQTPTTIAANTGHEQSYVGERCRHLLDHELVERVERGKYRLSERGEMLLAGDIDPSELQ